MRTSGRNASFVGIWSIGRVFTRADRLLLLLLLLLLVLKTFKGRVLRTFVRMTRDGRGRAVAAGRGRRGQRPSTIGIIVEIDDGFKCAGRRRIERRFRCVLRFGCRGTERLRRNRQLLLGWYLTLLGRLLLRRQLFPKGIFQVNQIHTGEIRST